MYMKIHSVKLREGAEMGIRAKISVLTHLEHLNTLEPFLVCLVSELWSWAKNLCAQ